MKATSWLCSAALALALVGGIASRAGADFPPGKAAPAFALHQFDGSPVSLSNYKGKVVVLHFWEPNCSSCNEEIPALEKLYKQYAAQGLQVIGMAEARISAGEIPAFIKRFHTSYPIALDPTLAVGRSYRVHGHPTTVLVDRDGIVRHVHNGWMRNDASTLEHEVQAILKGGKLTRR